MLDLALHNVAATVVVWLINMFVGALWYSPVGFAKQWEQHTDIDIMKLPKEWANKALGFVALSALVQAIVLSIIIHNLGATTFSDGLIAGFVLWLGLTAATTVGVTFYSKRSWGFWWLNASYFLLVMCVNSVILAVWR